jgi:biopolymer transport protein ExbD
MVRLRRQRIETRVEIMPLVDVIFLLLTFFIYAMMLMVRAEMVPVNLPELQSGVPATPAPAVTISIDAAGALYVDREPVAPEDIRAVILRRVADDPDTIVYIAADERGDEDRLPIFIDLYDRLANAGLTLKIVGRPKDG